MDDRAYPLAVAVNVAPRIEKRGYDCPKCKTWNSLLVLAPAPVGHFEPTYCHGCGNSIAYFVLDDTAALFGGVR